jgi:hypothetical protein
MTERQRYIVALRTAAQHKGEVNVRGAECRVLADLLEEWPASKREMADAMSLLAEYEGRTLRERLEKLLDGVTSAMSDARRAVAEAQERLGA